MSLLTAPCALLLELSHKRLPEYVEVGLVGAQAKHDQIGVGPIDTMTSVWFVTWLGTLRTDKFEDLVFSFSRDRGI